MTNEELQKIKDEVKDLHIKFLQELNALLLSQKEWKPIATAPKDKWILASYKVFRNSDWDGSDLYLPPFVCCFRGKEKGWCTFEDEDLLPTHWMPLPKPPAQ